MYIVGYILGIVLFNLLVWALIGYGIYRLGKRESTKAVLLSGLGISILVMCLALSFISLALQNIGL